MLAGKSPAILFCLSFILAFQPLEASAAGQTEENKWLFILGGGLFILFYAASKFNMWTDADENKTSIPPRHFTTWARFFRYACLYVFLTELVYVMLVFFPREISEILTGTGMVNPGNSLFQAYAKNSALFSVIIITGVADSFAFIKNFEQKIRRNLHNRAFIPEEAKDAVKFFQNDPSTFRPDPRIIKAVLKAIDCSDFSEKDFDYAGNQDGETLSHKLCKLAYLGLRLKEKDIHTHTCIPICGSETRLTCFLDKIKTCAKEVKDYMPLKSKGSSQELLEQALIRQIDEMLTRAYEFIGCHILATTKMPFQRNLAYKYFGLHLNPTTISPVDWDTIVLSLVCVFLATVGPGLGYYFLAGTIGYESRFLDINDPIAPIVAAMISVVMNGLAIIAVTFYQRRKAKKNELLYGSSGIALPRNRLLGIVFSSCWGFALGVMVLIQARIFLKDETLINALVPSEFWLWGCGPAITGAFIYYYLEHSLVAYKKQWRESIIQGTVTASIMTIVSIFAMGGKIGTEAPFYAYTIVTSFAIGSSVGYIFPEGFRRMKKDDCGVTKELESRYLLY